MEIENEYYNGRRQDIICLTNERYLLLSECNFCEIVFVNGCSIKCFIEINASNKFLKGFIKIHFLLGNKDKELFISQAHIISFSEIPYYDVVCSSAGEYNKKTNEGKLPSAWL